MNNRHRQVEKWKRYYARHRWRKLNEQIHRLNDALLNVANAASNIAKKIQRVCEVEE